MSNETQKYELKIQALRESLASKTAQAEDQIADLRVEVTLKDQELQTALARIAALEAEKDVDVLSESDED